MKVIKYYDTHSHLNMDIYQNEIDKCIKDLIANNTITNCVGFDLKSSIKAVKLSKQYQNVLRACVGIHPNDVKRYINKKNETIKELDNLIANNLDLIVAIGEIGIDNYYDNKYLDLQIEFLHHQIQLGIKYNLPIMFHLRDAFNEIKPIIKQYQNVKKLIHCFSTNIDEATFYIENDCFISIPGIVTFKNAKSLQMAVKEIDLKHLVAETDAPFLTPVPYRGKTNYPIYVKHTIEYIADLKKLEVETVKKTLLNNAINFFNKWK